MIDKNTYKRNSLSTSSDGSSFLNDSKDLIRRKSSELVCDGLGCHSDVYNNWKNVSFLASESTYVQIATRTINL